MAFTETEIGPVTRVNIARYASAVGDFNPIHLDDDFAKGAGMPSTVAHGPLTIALLVDAVAAQLGAENLRTLSARLTAPVFPGDELVVVQTDEGAFEVRRKGGDVVATAKVETG